MKRLLSKILPRVYGDKLTVGGDPKAPIDHVVALDLTALSMPNSTPSNSSLTLGWRRKTCRITVNKWKPHGIRRKWDQRLIN